MLFSKGGTDTNIISVRVLFLFCFTHIDINVACIRNDPELELALQCDARWFAEHVILTFPQILPPLSMSRSTIVFELEGNVSPCSSADSHPLNRPHVLSWLRRIYFIMSFVQNIFDRIVLSVRWRSRICALILEN